MSPSLLVFQNLVIAFSYTGDNFLHSVNQWRY